MAVRMTRLALGGGTENAGDVIVTFDVSLLREIQITTVSLRFACEGVLQILLGLAAFESHALTPLMSKLTLSHAPADALDDDCRNTEVSSQ